MNSEDGDFTAVIRAGGYDFGVPEARVTSKASE